MNRNQAKQLFPIIKAHAEGKTIEMSTILGWISKDDLNIDLLISHPELFRIKPDSKAKAKYRPFANGEECMKEMRKHEPICLVINRSNDRKYNIQSIFIKNDILYIRGSYVGLVRAFNDYTFADGTPFGVKMEE